MPDGRITELQFRSVAKGRAKGGATRFGEGTYVASASSASEVTWSKWLSAGALELERLLPEADPDEVPD